MTNIKCAGKKAHFLNDEFLQHDVANLPCFSVTSIMKKEKEKKRINSIGINILKILLENYFLVN